MTDQITSDQVSELVDKYKQWTIGSDKAGPVMPKLRFQDSPDRSYNLKNKVPRKFLQYEEQDWGINLGWTDDASAETGKRVARWFFTVRAGVGRPVKYGETIALANGTGRSFLRYSERPRGINLDWSQEPVFEWQLLGRPSGQPVKRDEYLAIYNQKVGLIFCYFDRNAGGNIGWSDSKRWEDQVAGDLKDLLRKYGEEAVKQAVVSALKGA
jgi:hypothetical protein